MAHFECPALGRSALIGDFYDLDKAYFLPSGGHFGEQILRLAIRSPAGTSTSTSFNHDSLSERFRVLNVPPELQLHTLSHIFEVRGSGKFLHSEKTSARAVRVGILHRMATETEHLEVSHPDLGNLLRRLSIQDRSALSSNSMIVTRLVYGRNVIVTFEDENEDDQDAAEVARALNPLLQQVDVVFAGWSPSVETRIPEQRTLKMMVYSDFEENGTSCETFQEVIKQIENISSSIAFRNDGKGVPISYEMVPTLQIISPGAIIPRYSLDGGMISFFITCLEDVAQTRQELYDLHGLMSSCEICVPRHETATVVTATKRIQAVESELLKRLERALRLTSGGSNLLYNCSELWAEFVEKNHLIQNINNRTSHLRSGKKTMKWMSKMLENKVIYYSRDTSVELVLINVRATNIYILNYSTVASTPQNNWLEYCYAFADMVNSCNLSYQDTAFVFADANFHGDTGKPASIIHMRHGKVISEDIIAQATRNAKRNDGYSKTPCSAERMVGSEPTLQHTAPNPHQASTTEHNVQTSIRQSTEEKGSIFRNLVGWFGLSQTVNQGLNASETRKPITVPDRVLSAGVDKPGSCNSQGFKYKSEPVGKKTSKDGGLQKSDHQDFKYESEPAGKKTTKDGGLHKSDHQNFTYAEVVGKKASIRDGPQRSEHQGQTRQAMPVDKSKQADSRKLETKLVKGEPLFLQSSDATCVPSPDGLSSVSEELLQSPNETRSKFDYCKNKESQASSQGDIKFPQKMPEKVLKKPVPAMNILLLGESGVGKSTWINGVANYLSFDSVEEAAANKPVYLINSSFLLTDDDYNEVMVSMGPDGDGVAKLGDSATQISKSYLLSAGDQKLRLIDTPGIGDTKGAEKDRENFQDMWSHLSHFEQINGICILMKPNSSRMSSAFRFCTGELLAHLHKEAWRNIVFVFSNSRGTFYRPGDSLPILKILLEEGRGSRIQLGSDHVYCMDNEPVRLLAALQQGMEFSDQERENYSKSWNVSKVETDRLIAHIAKLEPHAAEQTLRLNKVLHLSHALAEAIVEACQDIQLRILKAEAVKTMDRQTKFQEPTDRKQAKMIVCCNYKCPKNNHHKSKRGGIFSNICHKPCEQNIKPKDKLFNEDIKKCDKINVKSENCTECGCSWNKHMCKTYSLDEEFADKAKFPRDLESDRLSDAKDRIKELRSEQKSVLQIGVKLGAYIRENSLGGYRDVVAECLEERMEKEQKLVALGGSAATHNALEEVMALYRAEAPNRYHFKEVTFEEIQKCLDRVDELNVSGRALKNCVQKALDATSRNGQYCEEAHTCSKTPKKP